MCGILGAYAPSGVTTTPDAFDRAMQRMRSRGPDDSGIWRDERVWLGHQRLAVMGPGPAGHQPMVSADGRYVLLFNGAIYNHLDIRKDLGTGVAWRGMSDTETLLEAFCRWGIDCVARLNGMFAFAVWDRERGELCLARDRMGVKPLYYGQHAGQFVFGSRPTAAATLLPDAARDFDWQSLRGYLECGFIPGSRSMYRALRKLPPAHYLVCNATTSRLVRYWDYRHIAPGRNHCSEDELVDEFDVLFDSAVRQRLLCDVPLGVFLSGGIDSSLVAAAMARTGSSRNRAFTISFSETAYDEGPQAQQIAAHLGLDLVTERLGANDLLTALPEYLRAVDEPIADSAGVATMVLSRVARQHITVALTGDGGDELFGGYPHYLRLKKLAPFVGGAGLPRDLLCRVLRRLPWHNGKLLAGALSTQGAVSLFHYLRSMQKDFAPLILPDVGNQTYSSEELFAQSAASMALDLDTVELGGRLDMAFTLPNLYLQKLDMATMAHAIEARSPFMDHRLVEWAMRLPVRYKSDGKQSKILLKKALCRRLPHEWVYRQKRGFSVPVGQWLQGPLREWAQDRLSDAVSQGSLPIDWKYARNLLNWQLQGRRQSYPLVWALLMLLEFVRNHGDLGASERSLAVAA